VPEECNEGERLFMITIFACPKPFRDHFGVIQTNAIRSWTLLEPKPEVILVGDDEGVLEVCKEFALLHIADIEKNEYGTTMVNSVFQVCQDRAKHSVICYVNSDIILLRDFMPAVATVSSQMPEFLMIGRRWDVEIKRALDFSTDSWEKELQLLRAKTGILHSETAMDYFVFRRGLFNDIPPLAIGRLRWDNWLVWRARSKFVPVVDATANLTAIHQDHDYRPGTIKFISGETRRLGDREDSVGVLQRSKSRWVDSGPEARRNDELVPENKRHFGVWASTWTLDGQGALRRYPLSFNVAFLKYQFKWVLPLYAPMLGRMNRWISSVVRAFRRHPGRNISKNNAPQNRESSD
jgi:hypothetical protein